jgi:hypothetical protein
VGGKGRYDDGVRVEFMLSNVVLLPTRSLGSVFGLSPSASISFRFSSSAPLCWRRLRYSRSTIKSKEITAEVPPTTEPAIIPVLDLLDVGTGTDVGVWLGFALAAVVVVTVDETIRDTIVNMVDVGVDIACPVEDGASVLLVDAKLPLTNTTNTAA